MDLGTKIAQLEKRIELMERASRLSHASLDDTALQVYDGAGGLRGVVGQQGDGTTAVTIVNGGPPPTPSTPTASPALGGIAAGWDGTFADGAIIPMDWARTEVHASPTAGFPPTTTTLQATIETAQGGIVYIPATGPLYVLLVARNTSGAASEPTSTVGPYSPRPVAGEIGIGEITATLIADGAVTTPKLFANAVTTAKLDVGSVDATALKADAITGKTITGGSIDGAEFHSDNGSGSTVDILNGTVTATASNGWKIIMDPTQASPTIDFLDNTGSTAGSINAIGNSTTPILNISSGPFTDGAVTDWRWENTMGLSGAVNAWRTTRVRESDDSVYEGGYLSLEPTRMVAGVVDSASPTTNTILQTDLGSFTLDGGRLTINPPASSSPGLLVSAKTGHTGYLLRCQVNNVDQLIVSPTGAIGAAGGISGASLTASGTVTGNELNIANTTWTSWSPGFTGGGSATFTTSTGWYYRLGGLVYVDAYIVIGTAGTGSTAVGLTMPLTPYRSGNRQSLPGAVHDGGVAGAGPITAMTLAGGSTAVFDRVINSAGTDVTGALLTAGSIWTFQGWYRV